jgi:hypothetical protein
MGSGMKIIKHTSDDRDAPPWIRPGDLVVRKRQFRGPASEPVYVVVRTARQLAYLVKYPKRATSVEETASFKDLVRREMVDCDADNIDDLKVGDVLTINGKKRRVARVARTYYLDDKDGTPLETTKPYPSLVE